MSGFLFDKMIFGPVRSRRLGNSLGINLLPENQKICTFDCIYCECGWTPEEEMLKKELPTRTKVIDALENKLIEMKSINNQPDSITFAGNGEPTIHPEFSGIVEDTLRLRAKYFPMAEVTVLSNSSTIHKPEIFKSLSQVDNNILKLDAGLETTFRKINRPRSNSLTLDNIVQGLRKFGQKAVIQTLFLRGEVDGEMIDNTKPAEIHAWLNHIKIIKPRYVMLYPIARETPAKGLQVIPREELYKIADQLRQIRVKYSVY